MNLTFLSGLASSNSFVADTAKNIVYSADQPKPLKILFDYYHHSKPSTKVGNFMVTGSWLGGEGRYAWNDYVHSNTFDPVFTSLGEDFYITIGRESFTKKVLSQHDAVLIINPDNPKVVPQIPVITDAEIKNVRDFVYRGGSLMVMINAGGIDRASEDFESVQLRKLVRSFGLDWNNDDTHYSDVKIGDTHPYFYDLPVFHYGAGCTIQILPGAEQPETLMEVASDAGYPDRHIRGPGMVLVRHGKGKMILVGDAGSWTGNMSRPWAENDRILKQLFMYLKPDNGGVMPQYPIGKAMEYNVTISGLQAIPNANSISEIPKEGYEMFKPRERTNMPYLEGTARLVLTNKAVSADQSLSMEAAVSGFKWFNKLVSDTVQRIRFVSSRQGKVSNIDVNGKAAAWLAPEMSSAVALTPVEGIRPGDKWLSQEWLRIPVLDGTSVSPVRNLELEVTYVRDEMMNGIKCRLYRSADELWLNDLNIKAGDLLPDAIMNRVGGSHFKFFNARGGKLLFKKEQWVDARTGVVIKARNQSRILAWIEDTRKKVDLSNADKDNSMILSLAQIITLDLKK